MTALVDRGANLLVTVSPVARCYIFITQFYIHPQLSRISEWWQRGEFTSTTVDVCVHMRTDTCHLQKAIKSAETNIHPERSWALVGVRRSAR